MSIDQLRHGFQELTADVVPATDPYRRVLRRAARRRRARRAWAAVAVVVAALATGGGLQVAGQKGTVGFGGWPISSEWTRALIDSPTRGDFAADPGLLAEVRDAERWNANPNLPQLKVLWLGGTRRAPVALVARYSATRAVLDSLQRQPGGQWTGSMNGVLTPLVEVHSDQLGATGNGWTLLLAPTGCDLALRNALSGGYSISMAPRGWVMAAAGPLAVRVTCAGVVRQDGPVGLPDTLDPATDAAGATTAQQALSAYVAIAPSAGRSPSAQVAWAGTVPGHGAAAIVVDPSGPDRPALLLLAGTNPKALLALAPVEAGSAGDNPTDNQAGRESFGLVATSAGVGYFIVAVRLPAHSGARAVLTDQVLVYAGPAAAQVQALDSASTVLAQADVTGGIAVLSLPLGTGAMLRAVDAAGAEVGTRQLLEPATGARLFEEPIISDW